jgi:hypothetical protein
MPTRFVSSKGLGYKEAETIPWSLVKYLKFLGGLGRVLNR